MRGNTERRKADGLPPTETPPPGWEVCPLCELCEPRGEIVDPADADCEVYVGLEHIDSGAPRLRRWGAPGDVRSAKALFHPGDVLFGKLRPYLEKAVLADCYGICSTDIIVLKPLRRRVLPQFLAYVLHTPEFVAYATSTMRGVNHPRTSWQAISEFKVLVPPVEEQRKIAAVLSAVQEAKEKTEAVIEAAKALKRALLKYLFTYGPVPVDQADRVELKETEAGLIPLEWEAVTIGEVAHVRGGYGFPHRYQGRTAGQFPFYKVSDMNTPGNETVMLRANNYVDTDVLEDLRAKPFPPGTVIFPKIGGAVYTNKKRILLQPSLVDNNVMGVTVADTDRCMPEFLFWTLQNIDLGQLASRGPLPSITAQRVKRYVVALPPLEEQQRIVDTLRAVESKLQAERERRSALETLFKALLRDLMTGRIRVNDLDLEVDA